MRRRSGTRYNQFFTTYRPTDVGFHDDTDWRAWRPSLPAFNDDPGGPGGYGIFQNTRPNIPRGEIWNWKTNVTAGIDEIHTVSVPYANRLITKLGEAYPAGLPIPNFDIPRKSNAAVTHNMTPFQIAVLTRYNGVTGDGMVRVRGTTSCISYDANRPIGTRWRYIQNINRYLSRIADEID